MSVLRHFVPFAWMFIVAGATAGDAARPLTLKEARRTALEQHPRITVAELKALVAKQAVRDAQGVFYPNLSANVAAVGAVDNNTRIVSTGLPVSSVMDRGSAAISLTQLVTDFGRSANLIESSRLKAQAEGRNSEATRAQLMIQVDAAFLGALQARAVAQVAQETVKTRQILRDQVSVLASNQIKSDIDLGFTEVGLQEAQLVLIRAAGEVEAADATLENLLGTHEGTRFELADEPLPVPPDAEAAGFVSAALRDRPELLRLRLDVESAKKFARAEGGLLYPSLSLQGTTGVLPYRERGLNHDYAAAGMVLSWPLFNGELYGGRRQAAALRFESAEAVLREEEGNVVRDVRIAWINTRTAWERLAVTEKLVATARKTYVFAEARYKAGSSSVVELSQAQLNLTSSEITRAAARYEFILRRALLDYHAGALK